MVLNIKSFNTFFAKDSCHYTILAILSIYILAHYLVCARTVVINADASYYVGVSRLLMEGKTPFLDFALGYTPLSFYLMCLPFSIFGISYNCAITTLYFIQVINALLIYSIFRKENLSIKKAWLGALLFLLYAFLFEGCMYVLEPFVILFGLIAIRLFLNDSKISLFLSGFSCACSFLCKQYGLGFVILAIIYILLRNGRSKRSIKGISLLLIGFFSFFILFVSFMLLQGVEPIQMLSLSGSDYERNGFRGFFAACYFLLRKLSPLFVAFAISIICYKRAIKDKFWILCVLGIAGFMLPCYVRFYQHYLLLTLPFIFFLIIHSLSFVEKDNIKKAFVLWIILSSLMPLYSMHKVHQGLRNLRKNQELVSNEIAKYIPSGEKDVFLSFNALYLSLTNSYTPPLLKKYGMSNGFVTKQKEVLDILRNSNYSVIYENDYNNRPSISNSEVKDYLKRFYKLRVVESSEGRIMLYTRKQEL